MWKTDEVKSIWPYTYFKSIEEIESCTEFPPKEAFYNDLKQQSISENQYQTAREEYYYRRNLPDGQKDKIKSMRDWLISYNKLDVAPLLKALSNCFLAFYDIFGKDPTLFNSLPSMALETALSLYDSKSPLAWTFKPGFDNVRKLFRSNIIGGLGKFFILVLKF